MLPGGRELILDAAHNPAGAAALASYLTSAGGTPPVLVFAAMRDKDCARHAARAAAGRRAIDRHASRQLALGRSRRAGRRGARDRAGVSPSTSSPSPVEALDAAWTMSSRVVVAGSIFLLGDIMKEIGA